MRRTLLDAAIVTHLMTSLCVRTTGSRLRILPALAGLIALSAALAGAEQAGVGTLEITSVGPFGGIVRSILISRHDRRQAFLGTTDGQILKSVDGGATWIRLYPGIGQRQLVVDTLVEHPAQAGRLFAGGWDLHSQGGGLFESRDGGAHWTRIVLPGSATAVRGMGISHSNPDRMIVGTLDGVCLTEDDGATWRQVRPRSGELSSVESVAISSGSAPVLFIGTWHLGFRSDDLGRSWHQNSKGMMADSDMFSIAVDERNPARVYVGACTGVYRSLDGGRSWTRLKVRGNQFVIRTQVVYLDQSNPQHVFAGTTEGLYFSSDDGRNWRLLTSKQLTIHALAVEGADSRRILLGTEEEGVLRSEDSGKSWQPSNQGFAARRITRIIPLYPDGGSEMTGLLSGGGQGGFYRFDERRGQWVPLKGGAMPSLSVLCMLSLPDGRGALYGTPQGIYWARPDAARWVRLPGAIAQMSVNEMALDRENGWVFAGTNQGVFRARADDLDFRRPAGYRLLPRVSSLVVSAAPPRAVFAATHMGLLRSVDHGATWEIISGGLPADVLVECLAVDPSDLSHLYAGTVVGLFESRDGGRSWKEIALCGAGSHVPAVTFLDGSGRRIIAANETLGSVWLSADGGSRWSLVEAPELKSPVQCIAPDPTRAHSFFIGTATEGIYRVRLREDHASP